MSNDEPSPCIANTAVYSSVVFVIAKGFAFWLSNWSQTVMSSLLDSASDVLVMTINCLTRNHSRTDDYPLGRWRIPSVGVIQCSVIVITINALQTKESIQDWITGDERKPPNLSSVESITVVVIFASGLLFKLGVWLWIKLCMRYPALSDRFVAQDMLCDSINHAIVLICHYVVASYPKLDWIDNLGSIILSVTIIIIYYFLLKEAAYGAGGHRTDDEHKHLIQIVVKNAMSDFPQCKERETTCIQNGESIFVVISVDIPVDAPCETMIDMKESVKSALNDLEKVDVGEIYFEFNSVKEIGGTSSKSTAI